MSWCPRCDAIRPGDPDDECFECGADLLDSAVLGRPTRTGNHVLELDREAPPVEGDVEAKPTDVTRRPSADVPSTTVRRHSPIRRATIAGLCLLVVAVSSIVYVSRRHHISPRRIPLAGATATSSPPSPAPSPPFGSPVQGRLVFVTGNSLIELNLTDGVQNVADIDGDFGSYRISPDGSYGAYVDDHETLWRMNGIATQERRAIATGVQAFTWMGRATDTDPILLVVRTEQDVHGGDRTRVEVIDAVDSTTRGVLYEGPRRIYSIFEAGKSIVVTGDGDGGGAIFILDGARLRLIRNGYEPLALSPDGAYVLAVHEGEGGTYGFARIDLFTRAVRKIGADSLTPFNNVAFAPDGTAIVFVDSGPYRIFPSTGKAVRLKAATREFLGSPILLANSRWLYVGRAAHAITLEVGSQIFSVPFDDPNNVDDVRYVPI